MKKAKHTLVCKQCGKELIGSHYNSPQGAYCCDCWGEVPQKEKDKMLHRVLKQLANAPTLFTPPL